MDNTFIWLDGEFIKWPQANMHVLSHHYGIGVFEGVRSYATSEGSAIFRLHDHTNRLFRSAHIMGMKIPYDKNTLNHIQCELIKKNNFSDAYLRPLVFYGGEFLGLRTDLLSTHVMIAAIEWKTAFFGSKVKTSSFLRNHSNSVFNKAKANGNYMNLILASQEARACGANEALLLDQQGCVAEGTGANFFMVRNNVIYTPDLTSALEGITRETVFTLARDLGISIMEKRITRDEVYIADEAFFSGTAAEITPIHEVDGRAIGEANTGEITALLQKTYAAIVRGKNNSYKNWLTFVDSVCENQRKSQALL
jgi:branched-chain amino acid aminotransferase